MVSTSFALFIVTWNVIYWSIAGGCSSWWNTNAGGIKTANCRETWVKQLRWKVKLVHISVPGSFIRAVDDILFLVPFTETASSPHQISFVFIQDCAMQDLPLHRWNLVFSDLGHLLIQAFSLLRLRLIRVWLLHLVKIHAFRKVVCIHS